VPVFGEKAGVDDSDRVRYHDPEEESVELSFLLGQPQICELPQCIDHTHVIETYHESERPDDRLSRNTDFVCQVPLLCIA